MRVFLLSLFGLVIFIIVAFVAQHQIETASKTLDQEIIKVENDLTARRWDQITRNLESLKRHWDKTKPFWAILLHHQEIDSIDQALVRTMEATKMKNYSETQIELGSLQFFIRHIPEREQFNLVNVF